MEKRSANNKMISKMIKFSKVTKSFNGQKILDDLSFEVKQGETIGILGQSGVGKTTILKLITNTIQPDSGTIEIVSPKIGYVFQEPRLLPWRTLIENISLVLMVNGMSKKEANKISIGWIERLELSGFENHYPSQLSGGMAQRVSIARAFAIEPKILIMDEPFSNLDMKLKGNLLTMVEEMIQEYQTTVVYVTHDLLEAVRISHRLFRLIPGGIMQEIDFDEREAIIKSFISGRIKNALRKDKSLYKKDSAFSKVTNDSNNNSMINEIKMNACKEDLFR